MNHYLFLPAADLLHCCLQTTASRLEGTYWAAPDGTTDPGCGTAVLGLGHLSVFGLVLFGVFFLGKGYCHPLISHLVPDFPSCFPGARRGQRTPTICCLPGATGRSILLSLGSSWFTTPHPSASTSCYCTPSPLESADLSDSANPACLASQMASTIVLLMFVPTSPLICQEKNGPSAEDISYLACTHSCSGNEGLRQTCGRNWYTSCSLGKVLRKKEWGKAQKGD